MKTELTITSKGQTTIPVAIRKKLGIGPQGGSLLFEYDDAQQALIVRGAPGLRDIAKKFSAYIKPGTVPLENVSDWIAQNRKADQNGYVD